MTSLAYQRPKHLLSRWPREKPLCYWGGNAGQTILAVDFYEISYEEFSALGLFSRPKAAIPSVVFAGGYLGLISYDHYALPAWGALAKPPRVVRVERALVFDQGAKTLTLVVQQSARQHHPRGTLACALSEAEFRDLLVGNQPQEDFSSPRVSLHPLQSDAAYLHACEKAIREIKAGRFYQINLLRYFRLAGKYQRHQWLSPFLTMTGPYGCYFDLGDLALISFSPEGFLSLYPEGTSIKARTLPIKGTRPRGTTLREDNELAQELQSSPKDQAELHMIVDLLCNDLNTISRRGSVEVVCPGTLVSFPSVHHLQAEIRAELRDGITIGEVLQGVCPGGSITGCPKREVMQAIAEAEGRPRGYFMGHSFYLDDFGRFDSSVLIRTVVAEANAMHYAAGSGIVVRSDPLQELGEIAAKCRVVTATGYDEG